MTANTKWQEASGKIDAAMLRVKQDPREGEYVEGYLMRGPRRGDYTCAAKYNPGTMALAMFQQGFNVLANEANEIYDSQNAEKPYQRRAPLDKWEQMLDNFELPDDIEAMPADIRKEIATDVKRCHRTRSLIV